MTKSAAKMTTKTKTVPYDVAQQLRSSEEMTAYLDAWLIDAPDDAAGIARALGADGNPSFATVIKVVRALGVKLHAEAA